MVRIKSPTDSEVEAAGTTIEYANWIGTKHLSAIKVSIREEVVVAITLNEENGRMSVFKGGEYNDYQRNELGGKWRPTGKSESYL